MPSSLPMRGQSNGSWCALRWVAGVAVAAAVAGCGGEDRIGLRGSGGTNGGGAGGDPVEECVILATTVVAGEGLRFPDGTLVEALFQDSRVPQTDRLDGGAFQLTFAHHLQWGVAPCSSARPSTAALYIDVDGDGTCRLGADEIFVWQRERAPVELSTATLLSSISPGVPHCRLPTERPGVGLVELAQRLCPELGECLPFCSPPDPAASESSEQYDYSCPAGADPGVDAGVDAGG